MPAGAGFQLLVMATNWGFNGTATAFCEKAKQDGYDGVEVLWPADRQQQEAILTAAKKQGLKIAFLCRGDEPDWKQQLETFRTVTAGAAANTILQPLYINCHSGRDFFEEEQNQSFIDVAAGLEKQTGVKMYHETHRSRMLFAAHITKKFINKNPSLKLTLDISHWCNVHESMLEDQAGAVAAALEHTAHFHARIGHPEGPQINDPRAPEWEATIKQHFAWWDKIAERKRRNGEVMTVLTEFGPPTYMPAQPYTQQPVVDQWAVNLYMMKMLRQRYQ
ncbi:xylose isomerase [Niabella ginsenosidivorans]|uniref:Xylose isomerase n=2 Tax=Niabella ginsenosidivorans TaxID=1176587 RepID=A0A1A9I900_9BACT|nr:xylose isomerase [Niabella ginsenosidivorans]